MVLVLDCTLGYLKLFLYVRTKNQYELWQCQFVKYMKQNALQGSKKKSLIRNFCIELSGISCTFGTKRQVTSLTSSALY